MKFLQTDSNMQYVADRISCIQGLRVRNKNSSNLLRWLTIFWALGKMEEILAGIVFYWLGESIQPTNVNVSFITIEKKAQLEDPEAKAKAIQQARLVSLSSNWRPDGIFYPERSRLKPYGDESEDIKRLAEPEAGRLIMEIKGPFSERGSPATINNR